MSWQKIIKQYDFGSSAILGQSWTSENYLNMMLSHLLATIRLIEEYQSRKFFFNPSKTWEIGKFPWFGFGNVGYWSSWSSRGCCCRQCNCDRFSHYRLGCFWAWCLWSCGCWDLSDPYFWITSKKYRFVKTWDDVFQHECIVSLIFNMKYWI